MAYDLIIKGGTVVVGLVVAKQFGVFPIREPAREPISATEDQSVAPSPVRPSIAVLPFTNMSSDKE